MLFRSAVPSALANDDPERETLLQLSQALSGEQIQLYYQCAIHGKQDLSLASDEYAGFVMTLLRMLAFAPLAADAHDVGGHIENTELHSAETGVHTAKKPLQLPQSKNPHNNTCFRVIIHGRSPIYSFIHD